MKICIVGCGYLGKTAAKHWKTFGHEITVTARTLTRAYELRPLADLVYILSDDWRELVEKQDIVLLSVAPDGKSDYIQTYLRTAEALTASVKNSSVTQIIYTGSSSVYGDHAGAWVDENSLTYPLHANAEILLAAEKTLLKMTHANRQVCIFRLGEIYGPGRSLVDRVKRMQVIPPSGHGDNTTNLIHLDEIISALDIAVQKKLNGIYNLCNDIHIPRREMYQRICELHGWPEIQWNQALKNPHGGNKKVSNEKLKSIGWTPINPAWMTISSGLNDIIS